MSDSVSCGSCPGSVPSDSNTKEKGSKAVGTIRITSTSTIKLTKQRSLRWFITVTLVIMVTIWNIMTEYHQLPQFLFSFNNEKSITKIIYGPEEWSNVKLLIYMTTHLPNEHIAFLPCWKDAIQRLDLFKYADLMLYTATTPTEEQLKLLPFRNTIVKIYK